jgi:hypothetical protein
MGRLKLALCYNPKDHKLQDSAYSHTYKNQFFALKNRFDTQDIVGNADMRTVNADVIIFYDIHSCYNQNLKFLDQHKAIKYEYFNDPHQTDDCYVQRGTRVGVKKLGAKKRVDRALDRGANFIICPQKNVYYSYLAPHLGYLADKMLVWFPTAPKNMNEGLTPLVHRKQEVILSGHLWGGEGSFRPYATRYLFAKMPEVSYVRHCILNPDIPQGADYQKFLSGYAAAIASCDTQVVPKYFEIPLAGCLCLAQFHEELYELGFRDFENIIYINKDNAKTIIHDIKSHLPDYQKIATAGRELVANNYTAQHFAEFIYQHAYSRCV